MTFRRLTESTVFVLLGIALLGGLYLTVGFLLSNPIDLSSTEGSSPTSSSRHAERVLRSVGRLSPGLARDIREVQHDSDEVRVMTHLEVPSEADAGTGYDVRQARRICAAVLYVSEPDHSGDARVRILARDRTPLARCGIRSLSVSR